MNLNYLGGIIDSEGCFRVKKTKTKTGTNYTPYFKIEMYDEPTIKLFSKVFGGNYITSKRGSYCWERSASLCIVFILAIKDFIYLKLEEAILLVELNDILKEPNKSRIRSQEKTDKLENLYILSKNLKDTEKQINIPDENFIPYLAGILDGDGAVNIVKGKTYKDKQYFESRIQIEMSSRNLIEYIANKLIRPVWSRNIKKKKHHKDMFTVSIPKHHPILSELVEYLVIKKEITMKILSGPVFKCFRLEEDLG